MSWVVNYYSYKEIDYEIELRNLCSVYNAEIVSSSTDDIDAILKNFLTNTRM